MNNRFGFLPSILCGFALGACDGTGVAGTPVPGAPLPADDPKVPPLHCKGPPYPIVLHHGFAGFERIGPVNYFFGVADDLAKLGADVHPTEVSPYDETPQRGAQLAKELDRILAKTSACKVNILAHSQGGLDSRYVISTLRYGARIASLATISTPHRGTPIAEAGLGLTGGLARGVVDDILSALQGLSSGVSGKADLRASLTSLTPAYLATFNAQNLDDPRVSYYSVSGRSGGRKAEDECKGGLWDNPWQVDLVDPLLVLPESIIAASSGSILRPVANDGIVPTASGRWGRFLGCLPADHFDVVGQIAKLTPDPLSGFSHKELYRRLYNQIRADGF